MLDPSLIERIKAGVVELHDGQLHGVVTQKDAMELLEAYGNSEKRIVELEAMRQAMSAAPAPAAPKTTPKRKATPKSGR